MHALTSMRLADAGRWLFAPLAAAAALWVYFGYVFGSQWYAGFTVCFLNGWALLLIAAVVLSGILVDKLATRRGWSRARTALAGLAFAGAVAAFTVPLAQSWAVGHPLDKDGQLWAGLIPVNGN